MKRDTKCQLKLVGISGHLVLVVVKVGNGGKERRNKQHTAIATNKKQLTDEGMKKENKKNAKRKRKTNKKCYK